MKNALKSLVLIAGAACALDAQAQPEFSLGAKAGTLGLGLEAATSFRSNLNGRLGFNTWTFDRDGTESDINYQIDFELQTITAFVDWFPFSGGFHLSGGLVSNGNELSMKGESSVSYTIGDNTYTPADVGTLSGKVDFDSVAPYLGIGWGNSVADTGFSFGLDVGILFQGSPNVNLGADGLLASDPTFQADLRKEEEQLQSDLDSFDLYPVVNATINYRF